MDSLWIPYGFRFANVSLKTKVIELIRIESCIKSHKGEILFSFNCF